MEKELQTKGAPALERGLKILELLTTREEGFSFGEIIKTFDLPTATAARLLKVLIELKYISKDDFSGKYSLGPKMRSLGVLTPVMDTLRNAGKNLLKKMRDETKNTCLLLFWDSVNSHCLAKCMREDSIPMQETGTVSRNLCYSPWGWMFLDSLPEKDKKKYFINDKVENDKPLIKYINEQTDRYHKTGIIEDLRGNLRRFAIPVRDRQGEIIGALAIGGNILSIKDKDLENLRIILKKYSDEFSEALGFCR